MPRPFFSVLTPVYNHGRFVAATLDSVLAQTDPDWESVVVNDGSTDDTPAVLARCAARDPRIRVFHQSNGGCSSALNRAVREMRGEWALWLSSDDLFAPDKLTLHRDWIARRPDRKFFYTHFNELDNESGAISMPDLWYPVPDERWQVLDLLRCNYVQGISVCIHRDALATAGPFDESLRMGQDYDMWLRLMARFPAVYIDRRTCTMRRHPDTNTVRFNDALLFDAAKAAIRFLNSHGFEAMLPLVDLSDPEDSFEALRRALDVAASPHSHIYKMGPHPAMMARILEWVDATSRQCGSESSRDYFVSRAQTAGHSQAGSGLGTMWRAAASAARHARRPVVYHPVAPEDVLDATYCRMKTGGERGIDAVIDYYRCFEKRAAPEAGTAARGKVDELTMVAAPGARLDDAIPGGALRMTLEMTREVARGGRNPVLFGLSASALRFCRGVTEVGCADDEAVVAAVRSFRPFGALVAVARSDAIRCIAAGSRAVYHHNLFPIPGGMTPAELLRRRIRVFAVSQASRHALAKWGVPMSSSVLVPNAFDASTFRLVGAEGGRQPHDLVYAGDLYPLKGVDIAVEAFRLLRQRFPDARLHVFGQPVGEWTPGSDHCARPEWIRGGFLDWERIQADIPGVAYHGHVAPARLALAFREAGLLVLPSRRESLGLVSLEAQACGCIPVLPAEGGMPETVDPDRTGFLYTPNTPSQLAETISGLWRDGKPSEECRLLAADRVRRCFSIEQSCRAFLQAVDTLPPVPVTEVATRRARELAGRVLAKVRRFGADVGGRPLRKRPLKVMFTFQAAPDTPNYYDFVLNKIHSVRGVEIMEVDAVPNQSDANAINHPREGADFRIVEVPEYAVRGGDLFLRGLWRQILKEKPDIVVTSLPHLKGFLAHVPTFLLMKAMRIRLILKSIPFRTLTRDAMRRELEEELSKGLSRASPRLVGLTCVLRRAGRLGGRVAGWTNRAFDRFRSLKGHVRMRFILWKAGFWWRFPDAHVNYIDDARAIYGSYGVPQDRIFVTYNSPDTEALLAARDRLRAEGIPRHPRRLIHVGRLVEWKRVDLLIEAVARLRPAFPDLELVVAGEGPKADDWKALARNRGVADCVSFVGGVYSPEALGRQFMASGIYVLGGMGGLSINDAMCFGLPVVCSVCDGTEKHLVNDGKNGAIFRPGDVDDLIAKMSVMLKCHDVCATMGAESLRIIREDVNVQIVVKEYVRAFEHVSGREIVGATTR